MAKKIFVVIALLVLSPLSSAAHVGHDDVLLVELEKRAGILPGEILYTFDRLGEWIRINLFTLSTKQKQEKKLELTGERLAEFMVLVEKFPDRTEAISAALRGYEKFLGEARDMAEKIIFLDGTEIALAAAVEEKSRLQEAALLDLLFESDQSARPYITQAVSTARIENEQIFKYMVTNYQRTDTEVEKHKAIILQHLELVESRFLPGPSADVLAEARKFQEAGLNIQAYDYLKMAKNDLYGQLATR